jgi:hypothetical protein
LRGPSDDSTPERDHASQRRLAENMVTSAQVCARMGHHKEAVKLLTMSVQRLPLERRKPDAVNIVKRARNAIEANSTAKVGAHGRTHHSPVHLPVAAID